MTALIALIRKDLILHFSNRRALIIGIVAPIVLAAFFGYLFNPKTSKPSRVEIVVSDLDQSPLSRELVRQLGADASLKLSSTTAEGARQAVQQGRAKLAILLPAGLGAALPAALISGGPKPAVELVFDPSQAMALAVVRGLLTQSLMKAMGGSSMSLPVDFQQQEAAATAGGQYDGFSHAFAGMGVQFVLFAGIDFGIGVLLARRMGLWRRLRAAPLSRSLLLGSRIVSGALIALLLVLVIFGAGIAIFGVRIHGSWLGFLMIVGAFALVTSTFGMLVAAFGRTPEATRSLANFGTLVMVMLGGAWVPSFLFPGWVQTLALALPARWVVDGLDAMTWRGLGLQAALAPTAALLGFALLFGLVAVWRFDWEE